MGALIFVLFLAVVGWNTFVQVVARQQTSITCSYDADTARRIVSQSFGMWWKPVPGKGDDNYKAKRGSNAPTLSIDYDMGESQGCQVEIWCSHGTKRYGVVNHAQLVWRKKRAVAKALAQAELTHSQGLPQPSSNGTASAISPRQQASAQPEIGAVNHFGLVGADRLPARTPDAGIDGRTVPPLRPPPPLEEPLRAASGKSMTPSGPPIPPPGQSTALSGQRPRGRHSRPDDSAEVPPAGSGITGARPSPAQETAGAVKLVSAHSDSRTEAGRGAGSPDGSSVIEAWLNELEAAQPQYGPLLKSTLGKVGNLPVVGDDGIIYTVSHDRYWYAVGYARSYASSRADNRRITAVLAAAEPNETKDEVTMIRREAEAEFWQSVQLWVDSAAP